MSIGLQGLLFAVIAWLSLTADSFAGTLSIWPVRITMEAQGSAKVVNLTNRGDTSSLVQVEAFAWHDATEVEGLEPTRDLLVVPPVFEVAAQSTQIIRLALRKPVTAQQEATYRLVITEVPRQVGDAGAVSFVVRLNLPVFVTPKGALPQPKWTLASDGGGGRLTLGNEGNAHVRVEKIALFADGGEPVFSSEDGGYVLAGGERSWQVDLGRLKAGAPLTVKAETNLGELESVVEVGG